VVAGYSDKDGVNFRFVNEQMNTTPSDVTVEIRLADGTPITDEIADIWGFGFEGKVGFADGGLVAYTESPLSAENHVTIMFALNKGILSPSRQEAGSFEEVQEKAFQGSDYDDVDDGELSRNIEEKSQELSIPVSELAKHPDKLEKIISDQFDITYFFLEKSKSSGIFFVLDATVNPTLYNSQNSKAGLYLKNMEPNIINSSHPNIIVLRGFPSLGRKNSLSLHTQWKMEFDVSNASYYHLPMEAARSNPQLPLSRLYYWTPVLSLPGTSEESMICSAPLIDSQGNVFGVCGLDISKMLFKLAYKPPISDYNSLIYILASYNGSIINLREAMIAGAYSSRIMSKRESPLSISQTKGTFHSYHQGEDNSFWGLHTPIHMYPEGSSFADQQWIAVVMIPEEDIVLSMTRFNMLLISLLLILVIVGIAASLIISKRFLKPISKGLELIKSEDLSKAPRTNIPEIDDLIEFLAHRNQKLYEGAKQKNLSFTLLDEFARNTESLSPSERSVYELYAQGYTAKEIAETLCLSINTIKTHSKHIYAKLNITSRAELLLYVNLLEEVDKERRQTENR
jgi:DNA-binding CsgD family transcriptional regulator